LCGTCRGNPTIQASEADYRYWLDKFGVRVPAGRSALEVVRASGMPSELEHLAVDFVRDSAM
jgi:hypothetical protein